MKKSAGISSKGGKETKLPAIVGKGFIRFCHAMRIFFLLYGIAGIVIRIEQFCC
jgi:hypothetical protein